MNFTEFVRKVEEAGPLERLGPPWEVEQRQQKEPPAEQKRVGLIRWLWKMIW